MNPTRYLKIQLIYNFQSDYNEFKKYVLNEIANSNSRLDGLSSKEGDKKIDLLQNENAALKLQLKENELTIQILNEEIAKLKRSSTNNSDNGWHLVKQGKYIPQHPQQQQHQQQQQYQQQQHHKQQLRHQHTSKQQQQHCRQQLQQQQYQQQQQQQQYQQEYQQQQLQEIQQHQKQHPRQQHLPRQYPCQQPTHQQHRQRIERRTVPGNSNYASITAKGKKIVVFGDSLVKRIRVERCLVM